MKDELQALLPDVTIGIAHGQMAGSLLESVMFDFYEGNTMFSSVRASSKMAWT